MNSQVLSAAKDPPRKCVGDPSPLTQLRIWAAAAVIAVPQAALACPVCFGVFFDAGEFRQVKEPWVMRFFSGLLDRKERR